jgi:hypothetical protein
VGASVRLSVKVPVTAGPVLTVPVAAIVTAVHGRPAHVVVVTAARRRVVVPIITGPVADGLVAVQPVHTGGLRPGDRVLIGSGR